MHRNQEGACYSRNPLPHPHGAEVVVAVGAEVVVAVGDQVCGMWHCGYMHCACMGAPVGKTEREREEWSMHA